MVGASLGMWWLRRQFYLDVGVSARVARGAEVMLGTLRYYVRAPCKGVLGTLKTYEKMHSARVRFRRITNFLRARAF